MSERTLVFLLEEPSAREMLEGILPRLSAGKEPPEFAFLVFQGKSDLEKNLKKHLEHWQKPNSCFLILRDQDAADCEQVKKRLASICQEASKSRFYVRIACRELETFYLGDLQAVEDGLQIKGLAKQQNTQKYREPDRLGNPSEEMMKLTKNAYQKVQGSRAIAPLLDLDPQKNRSRSFQILIQAILLLIDEP